MAARAPVTTEAQRHELAAYQPDREPGLVVIVILAIVAFTGLVTIGTLLALDVIEPIAPAPSSSPEVP